MGMSRIVAGILGMTALASSIFAGLDPVSCIIRGGIAFSVGLILGSVWEGLTRSVMAGSPDEKPTEDASAETMDEAA